MSIAMSAWIMHRCHEGLKAVHSCGVNIVVQRAHCALTHFNINMNQASSALCHHKFRCITQQRIQTACDTSPNSTHLLSG